MPPSFFSITTMTVTAVAVFIVIIMGTMPIEAFTIVMKIEHRFRPNLCRDLLVSPKKVHSSVTSLSATARGGGGGGGRGGRGSSSSSSSSSSMSRSGGGKDASIRQARVARSLRDELSEIICDCDIKAVNYPDENLLRATSIVDVEVSPDLSYAKIFVSVMGNSVEKRQIFVWLCENVGQVRYSLAQRLRHMRKVPDIFFKLSENQANADLVTLIDSLNPSTTKSASVGDDFEFEEGDNDEEEDSLS